MTLAPNQVFIFGSNSTGFHGAGSAGLACRGIAQNTWRTDPWFLAAMKSPHGSLNRVGKWAVYGEARGFQVGREGMSYAIQTIERPGLKRSTSLAEISSQLAELFVFAKSNYALEFVMTPIGSGLAGWTDEEMKIVWDSSVVKSLPNIIIPSDLYVNTNFLNT